MFIVIYKRIKGQGNLIGIIKSILIAFVFAPLQIELIGYSLMMGINEFSEGAKQTFLFFNFVYKPLLFGIFYIFFIPI